jgi:hypothetical protein
MKIRQGFVSNSSSSSYVCNVCGETAMGMDVDLNNWEMFSCENGHYSCVSHEVDVTDEIKKEILLNYTCRWEDDKGESIRVKAKEILDGDLDECWEDLFDETFEDYTYESPAARCPICQFTEISQDDAVKYIFKKNNTTEAEIMKEMKEKFSNYAELQEYFKDEEGEKDED